MLSLIIYLDSSRGQVLLDATSRLHPPLGGGLVFGNNRHGFAAMSAPFIPMDTLDAFAVYDWPAAAHAVVAAGGADVWEGRVETRQIVNGGVSLSALGYWRAMSDVPYTALWSVDTSADWRPLPTGALANRNSHRFTFDNNNRVFIATQKNSAYPANLAGAQVYYAPDGGERDFAEVVFTYEFNMSASWTARVVSATADLSATTTEWSLLGTGAVQTGTVTLATAANRQAVLFEIANTSGGAVTESGETGDNYLKVTAMRLKTTTGTVLASEIATDVVAFVNGVNPGQLAVSTAGIVATTADWNDLLYHDIYPANILDALAAAEGYEVGVWNAQRLFFRPLDSESRTVFIDVSRLEIEQDLDVVRNEVYGVYRDANGRLLRTANAANAGSAARLGITRRAAISVNSASATEAEAVRDAALAARGDYTIRAAVEFSRVYNEIGVDVERYEIRSGWTVVMRNLPPTLTTGIDNFRSFRIAACSYDAAADVLSVEPEVPVPTLVTLVVGA